MSCTGPSSATGERGERAPSSPSSTTPPASSPFAAFATAENVQAFLPVLRDALIRRGIPQRLYVDNGANYRSRQLALVYAKLGIALIHARPYQPAGKGKTERWFRTLRAGWLAHLDASLTDNLQTLNRSLWAWSEGEYHNTPPIAASRAARPSSNGRSPVPPCATATPPQTSTSSSSRPSAAYTRTAPSACTDDSTRPTPFSSARTSSCATTPRCLPTGRFASCTTQSPQALPPASTPTPIPRSSAASTPTHTEPDDPAPEPPRSPLSLRNLKEDD